MLAYRSNIFSFVSQDASCLLKTKLIFLDRGYGTALFKQRFTR